MFFGYNRHHSGTPVSPLGSGHHIFADRFYTTYSLLQYLTDKKYFYTGTVQSNRKNFPDEIKRPPVKYQEQKYYRTDKGFLVVLWKDKKSRKPVIAVSSKYLKGSAEVCAKHGKKTNNPDMIHNYNQSMNGCDRLDQLASYYSNVDRKAIKWWKRIFQWLIEIVQVNAYIIYTLTRDEKRKRKTFKNSKSSL